MARHFEIAPGRLIGDGFPCYIIAEIGQNHQGDINVAKQLIQVAKQCGADAVKFQKSDFNSKFTKSVLCRKYDSPHSFGATYGEHKSFLEFSQLQYQELKHFAEALGIHFSASAMDELSLEFLISLKVPFLKIGSGDANNFLLLEKAAKTNLPLIYSTGMQDENTVRRAYNLMSRYNKRICVLQCTSSYPTPLEDVHLNVIKHYRNIFPDSPIGYSGHELGVVISQAAVAIGANVIERHITLDKKLKGNDHSCSLDPTELRTLIQGIRDIEAALGTGVKRIQPSEQPCINKLGKSVVTTTRITAGTRLSKDHLCVKVSQPLGWSPQNLEQLIGRILSCDLEEDAPITDDCIEESNVLLNNKTQES